MRQTLSCFFFSLHSVNQDSFTPDIPSFPDSFPSLAMIADSFLTTGCHFVVCLILIFLGCADFLGLLFFDLFVSASSPRLQGVVLAPFYFLFAPLVTFPCDPHYISRPFFPSPSAVPRFFVPPYFGHSFFELAAAVRFLF